MESWGCIYPDFWFLPLKLKAVSRFSKGVYKTLHFLSFIRLVILQLIVLNGPINVSFIARSKKKYERKRTNSIYKFIKKSFFEYSSRSAMPKKDWDITRNLQFFEVWGHILIIAQALMRPKIFLHAFITSYWVEIHKQMIIDFISRFILLIKLNAIYISQTTKILSKCKKRF